MGASDSIPLPRYSCCILPQNPDHCHENHARAASNTRRRRRRRRHMGWSIRSRRSDIDLVDGDASPDCYDDDELDPFYGRLDINMATAEELMTLPGINRATATNVVTYRAQIGGFRKVEDMALVPGVGATRFGHLRAEIYVADSSLLPSTSLRRSGSSATSSGIDVSLTPVDSVSRDFMALSSSLQNTSTTSAVYDDTDADSRLRSDTSVNSQTARECNDRTAVRESAQHRVRCPPATSDLRRPGSSDAALRLATWNLWPCSSDRLDDVAVRRLVTTTLLENL